MSTKADYRVTYLRKGGSWSEDHEYGRHDVNCVDLAEADAVAAELRGEIGNKDIEVKAWSEDEKTWIAVP